jgi:hypothetical protein
MLCGFTAIAGEMLAAIARGDDHVQYMLHSVTQLTFEGAAGGKSVLLTHANPTPQSAEDTDKALRFASKIKNSNWKTAGPPK